MFQSTVLMNVSDVMAVTGYKRSRAGDIVRKVNNYTESQGYITPKRGSCYIKAFCKLTGLARKEVLEAIRPGMEVKTCQEQSEP